MNKEHKNHWIHFRVTETEKQTFLKKVKEANTTESDLLRERILNDEYFIVAREPKASVDKKRLLMLFNKASNNLNQIAHQANSHNLKGTLTNKIFVQLLSTLIGVRNMLRKELNNVD